MATVNYIRENLAFMEYACDEGLTANERLLWYALFHIMNGKSNGSQWPEGLVPITHKKLLSLVPFGEDSLVAARNKLKQRGLIDFKPGKRNAAPPMYRLCYFCAEMPAERQEDTGSYPEISGNAPGNTWVNTQGNAPGNTWGNMPGETSGIIINYKSSGRVNRTPNAYAEDVDAAAEQARARQAQVQRVFREQFGRDALPAEAQQIVQAAADLGFGPDITEQAIARAAVHGARNPALYVCELIRVWHIRGVRSVYDLVCLDYEGHVAKEE